MTKSINLLVKAIDRVGVQNVSLLSRITGMPIETIRYTIKKRFPKLGLRVSMTLQQDAIGLERYFAVMRFSPSSRRSIPATMRTLSKRAFLTYWSRMATDERCVALFSVPVTVNEEFTRFTKKLLDEGILEEFEAKPLEWARHPELKSEYYDFASAVWNVNWEKVDSETEQPPSPIKNDEPSHNPDVDLADILMIKELELDAGRNVADIARKLGLNERTARWHYLKHVSQIASSSYVHWFPASPAQASKAVGLLIEFESVSRHALTELRALFNSFPFCWFEAGSKAGYYQVQLGMPAECFMEATRFLNERLPSIVKRWDSHTLDIYTGQWYTIPYENFDKDEGWLFDAKLALGEIQPARVAIKK